MITGARRLVRWNQRLTARSINRSSSPKSRTPSRAAFASASLITGISASNDAGVVHESAGQEVRVLAEDPGIRVDERDDRHDAVLGERAAVRSATPR